MLRPGGLLLTGYNKGNADFNWLWDALNADGSPHDGRRPHHYSEFPLEAGWQPLGDSQAYEYVVEQAPSAFMRLLERRVWSSLWQIRDEQLRRAIERVKAATHTHVSDLDTPLRMAETFYIQAFLPPQ